MRYQLRYVRMGRNGREAGLDRIGTISDRVRGTQMRGSPVSRRAEGPAGHHGAMPAPHARFGDMWAHDVEAVEQDLAALQGGGRWAVVVPYDGRPTAIRFRTWEQRAARGYEASTWAGPAAGDWESSMDEAAYCAAVETTRERIARGDLYQANICRILRAPVSAGAQVGGLFDVLRRGNPAPYAACIDAPGMQVASASPELFLRRRGDLLLSSPIKGTGRTPADLLEKDEAENIMIVDLVRNDLSRVCRTGTVEVPSLLRQEVHPGLVHLVSDVTGRLDAGVTWPAILDAAFPPGSVTGAPKSRALRLIAELEPASRHVYCGAIGWIDADRQEAELAVAIRTFWIADGMLHFGTGAGITWGSDPVAEWEETELKAARLIALASGGAG